MKTTLSILCSAAVMLTLLYGVKLYLDLPVVQLHYYSKKCIRVLPAGACDKLPTHYTVDYVAN